MSAREVSGMLNAKGMKFGLVVSRFNDFLTRELLAGAVDCLVRHGAADNDILVVWVPGSNEIPMAVHKLGRQGGCDAIAALGAVVQGATPHADLINSQVARALMTMAIEFEIPVINGVVSANTLEQAIERCGTKAGNKGWQAAMAAIEMANLYSALAKNKK